MKKFTPLIILLALLVASVTFAAFTEPPVGTVPPANNTPEPINQGPTGQAKAGDLTINGAGLFTNGLGMISGIAGNHFVLKNITDLIPAYGKVLMSNDANGTATWVATSTLGITGGPGGGYWTQTGVSPNVLLFPTDLSPNARVGIGTATPANKLEVAGNERISNSGDLIINEGALTGTQGFFNLYMDNDQANIRVDKDSNGDGLGTLAITSGNVGIGTTAAPTIKLAISDNDTGLSSPNDGVLAFYTNNTQKAAIDGSGNLNMSVAGSRITWPGASMYGTGAGSGYLQVDAPSGLHVSTLTGGGPLCSQSPTGQITNCTDINVSNIGVNTAIHLNPPPGGITPGTCAVPADLGKIYMSARSAGAGNTFVPCVCWFDGTSAIFKWSPMVSDSHAICQ